MKSLLIAALTFCTMMLAAATAGATSVCTWVTLGSCNFGTGYAGVAVDTTGTLVFNCTTIGTSVTLTMAGGNSGLDSGRYMANGSDHAVYQAYTDSAHTNFFGKGTGHTISVTPVMGNNTVTYYCELNAGQTLVAGTYTDSAVVTELQASSNSDANSSASLVATNSCDLSVTTNIAFGAYDAIGTNASTPLDGTGVVQVACTSGAPYTLMLNQGIYQASGSTTSVPLRQMASGSYRLPYFLYQNSGRSTVWGDTSGTGVSATGTGTYVNYTVYGQIPAGKTAAAAGSYTDTVTVTASY
jgi:spore coat protein U-like protein